MGGNGNIGAWWRISGSDGRVEQVASPPKAAGGATDAYKAETLLYDVLALAPELVELDDSVPLNLFGDQSIVDQQYVDRTGRSTLIECKKGEANLRDLVQLLGYAYMESGCCTPIGSFSTVFRGTPREMYGACLARATRPVAEKAAGAWLAASKASQRGERLAALDAALGGKDATIRLGATVWRRLYGSAPWKLKGEETIAEALGWMDGAPFLMAPPRLVLVAPSFSEECISHANMLSQRGVWLDLLAIDIRRTVTKAGAVDIYARCAPEGGQRCDAFHHLWLTVRETHADGMLKTRFDTDGLSCFTPTGSQSPEPTWSYTLKGAPAISVSLMARGDGSASVYVRLEHGSHDGEPRERRSAQAALRAALDSVPHEREQSFGNHTWKFTVPRQRREWESTFRLVCEAVASISAENEP
jgi:hypothetical protein